MEKTYEKKKKKKIAFRYSVLDQDECISEFFEAEEAISQAKIYISECRKYGLNCDVTIKDILTWKSFPVDVFEKMNNSRR